MRLLLITLVLIMFTAARADGPTPNYYKNSEYGYQIAFPAGWELVKPNKGFTHVKARAPIKGYATMSVGSRDSLWQGDSLSKQYPDAWKALDGLTLGTFTNRFERNPSVEVPTIFSVEKTTLGKEKAIKVDYLLTDRATRASVRLRAFFILHDSNWYSISCGTLAAEPDLSLDSMLKAAATLEFFR